MSGDDQPAPPWRPLSRATPGAVAYRAVLLAALLIAVAYLARELLTLLLAVVLTVILASALTLGTTFLHRRLRVPRGVGAPVLMLGVLGGLAGLVWLVVRPLTEEAERLQQDLPVILGDVQRAIEDFSGLEADELVERGRDFALTLLTPSLVLDTITAVGGVLLVLITAVYIAINPEPLLKGIMRLFPPERRPWAEHVLERLNTAWMGWLRGTAIDMVAVGVLTYVAFLVIGLPFALLLAVLAGLGEFVPYFGPFAAAAPAVLIAFTESLQLGVVTVVVVTIVQQIEGNLLVPLIMAKTVSLHPAVVAVGVIAIVQALGLVAVLVAVPLLSAVVILVEELWVRPREQISEERAADGVDPDG
ncbi:MAG TPA: AI-2E family transporter [Miltoncostaeaceae bacterium]|nr:AI-2E family transporter [Miltoncostaeaceae bacterium]